MGFREKLRSSASHLLQPGEQIQVVFPAQTTNPYAPSLIAGWAALSSNGNRVVVVTDRRILLYRTARIRVSQINEIGLDLPRNTVIGPASGLWYQTDALAECLFINRRYHKDVAAADSAIGESPS
jgi:hypothetical protein